MKKREKIDKWRMDTSALNQQHEEFRKAAAPLFDGMIPYDNRHTAATNHHKRAADIGLNGQAMAYYDNHIYEVALINYIAPLLEEVETVCRYPDELIQFCEQMVFYSLSQYELHPWQWRHLAAARVWDWFTGRTHVRQQIKAYRARKFDLHDPKTLERDLKTLCQRLGVRNLLTLMGSF
jgi:hypothetical protein